MSNKSVFVLENFDNVCRGVYTSMRQLKKGVDYWMKFFPNETLVWKEWDLNYSPEPNVWAYAYVSTYLDEVTRTIKGAEKGGATIPKIFGVNLIPLQNKDVYGEQDPF